MKKSKKITEITEPGLTPANRALIARIAKEGEGKIKFPEASRLARERAKSLDWSLFSPKKTGDKNTAS